ncbi:MAG: formyl transferase [Anaerolineales bacterium]|jgi:folate-dependent phosphoribosylglycinamide formyltransferase PurN
MSLRVVLFAPTPSSMYSRLLGVSAHREEGINLVGIAVRSMWSWKRIRAELRRDGARLIRKVYDKLWLGEEAYPLAEQETLPQLSKEMGLVDPDLGSLAERLGVPCIHKSDLNDPVVVSFLAELDPDVVIFSGGGLVREPVLKTPKLGVLNCHSGILPAYRGMDVVEWAILEAQAAPEIGLTLHFMDRGVDTGPILVRHREQIRPGDTLDRIRRRLEPQMVKLMMRGLRGLRDKTLGAQPQSAEDGRQYFVMHPRLRAAAAEKVLQIAEQS